MSVIKWWLSGWMIIAAQVLDAAESPAPVGGGRGRSESVVSGDSASPAAIDAESLPTAPVSQPTASLAPVAAASVAVTATTSGPMAELRARLAGRNLAQVGRRGASTELDAEVAAVTQPSRPVRRTDMRVFGVGAPAGALPSGFRAVHENETRERWTRNLIEELQLPDGAKTRKLNLELIQMALNNHADVDAPGLILPGRCLIVAPRTGAPLASKEHRAANTPLGWVIRNSDESAIMALKLLLAAGANPNQVGPAGKTPLQLAMQVKNFAAIPLLLQAGANSEVVLHQLLDEINMEQAFKLSDQDLKLFQVLLKHGVDVNQVDSRGDTPIKVLLYNLIQALSHYGPSTKQYAQYLRVLRLFMQAGADPKIVGSRDESAYDELNHSHGVLAPTQRQQLRLILDQHEHYLSYPWNQFPRIKKQLAEELADLAWRAAMERLIGVTDDGVYEYDDADEKTGIVELASKDDLAPRPESVQGPRALAAAVAALAAVSDDSESGTDDETVRLGGAVVPPATTAPRGRIPVLGTIPLAPAATEHDAAAPTAPYPAPPALRRSDSVDDYLAAE